MKKIITFALVLCVLAVMLVGCGKDEPADVTSVESVESVESAVTSEPADESVAPVVLTTYDEYVAAENQTEVTVEVYVQAKEVLVEGKCVVYTQNDEGAFLINDLACTEEEYAALTAGVKIRVHGIKDTVNGQLMITNATFEVVEAEPMVYESVDVSELFGTEALIGQMSRLVKVRGTVVNSQLEDGTEISFLYKEDGTGEDGDDIYFALKPYDPQFSNNIHDGFNVRVSLVGAESEVYAAAKEITGGVKVELVGFLCWNEGPSVRVISISPWETVTAE